MCLSEEPVYRSPVVLYLFFSFCSVCDIYYFSIGFRYTSMADVNEEQSHMTFTGTVCGERVCVSVRHLIACGWSYNCVICCILWNVRVTFISCYIMHDDNIYLPYFSPTVDNRREYHKVLVDEEEADTMSSVHTHLLSYQEESGGKQEKVEFPNATAIIEDTKNSAKELARRIPWGYFLVHPASRTLLFAYWVMSWIGEFVTRGKRVVCWYISLYLPIGWHHVMFVSVFFPMCLSLHVFSLYLCLVLSRLIICRFLMLSTPCNQFVITPVLPGYMMLSEIPSFLTDQLGYEIEEAGVVAILPYFAQFVSTIGFGQMFSILQRDYGWTTRKVMCYSSVFLRVKKDVYQVRQVAQFICFAGSGISLVICGSMKSVPLALFFLIIALFLYGATQSGLACAFLDVSPNYSCSLNSLANLIGALAGISAPLVVSAMVAAFGSAGWVLSFLLTLAQCVIALFFWYKYQTSEIVPVLNSPRPLKSVNYKECCPWFRM